MPSREQVLSLIREGHSYQEAAARLHVPPGQAYLVATGLPADGGDSLAPEDGQREGVLEGSTQHLANPTAENPTKKHHVLEWMKQRAGADAQMRSAAQARNAEPGPIRDPEGTTEVSVVLTWDHNQVKTLLEQLITIPGCTKGGSPDQMSQRKSIVDMVTVALSQHESVEEKYFWPAVRQALAHGADRADTALHQEQEGKDTLTALDKLGGDSEEFDQLVEELVLRARKHVAFEDKVLLDLEAAMSEEERAQLGARLLGAKRLAPTRPHPHAPQSPTMLKVAGAGAAAIDKVRDTMGDRPAKRKGKPEPEPE